MLRGVRIRIPDFIRVYGLAIVLVAIAVYAAFQFVEPAPPSKLTIATGSKTGGYYHFAQEYAKFLAHEGIELEIRETAGSLENLKLLTAEKDPVDIALVQSGTARYVADHGELLALGSVYYEPFWVFYRADAVAEPVTRMAQLKGLRIATGYDLSGTRAIALELLEANEVLPDDGTRLVPLGGMDAVDALKAGEIDVATFVSSPLAPEIVAAMNAPGIRLMDFARAPAYAQAYRTLTDVVLHEGVMDFAADLPDTDTHMLAAAATVVTRDDTHPALLDLMMQALDEVHGRGGLFEAEERFPSADHVDYELSEEAKRFYKSGPPFLQRYMPFWVATLIDRLAFIIIPFVALLIPLMRVLPPIYRWQVRSRIYRWYRAVRDAEIEASMDQGTAAIEAALAKLEEVEHDVRELPVPLAYNDELYQLRQHIQLVRERLLGMQAAPDGDAGEDA
jgi:TRAP transporter TAXI family solute receptor